MSMKSGVKQLHWAVCLTFAAAGHTAWVQQVPAASEGGASALPVVKVTAQQDPGQHLKEDVSSGVLGTRTQLDTPLSTTVVTSEQLQDIQPSKLGDVFATDASVSDNGNGNGNGNAYKPITHGPRI